MIQLYDIHTLHALSVRRNYIVQIQFYDHFYHIYNNKYP